MYSRYEVIGAQGHSARGEAQADVFPAKSITMNIDDRAQKHEQEHLQKLRTR